MASRYWCTNNANMWHSSQQVQTCPMLSIEVSFNVSMHFVSSYFESKNKSRTLPSSNHNYNDDPKSQSPYSNTNCSFIPWATQTLQAAKGTLSSFPSAFQTRIQKPYRIHHVLPDCYTWTLTSQTNLTTISLMRYNRRPLLSHSSHFTGPCQRYSVGLVFSKIPLSTFWRYPSAKISISITA